MRPRLATTACLLAAACCAFTLPGCIATRRKVDVPVVRNGPRDAGGYVERAQRLRENRLFTVALAELERAIEINPRLTTAYLAMGDIYRDTGEYAKAETSYATAAGLEPRNFDAQYHWGLSLQLLSRLPEAVAAYLRSLSIRPDDFNANLNIATAYMQLGEARTGMKFAQAAVRLKPDDGAARVNLGAIYAALGEHQSAVLEYQQAAEVMDLNPQLLLNLADSLAKIERLQEAQNTLEQLIATSPSAVSHERMGSVLFRLQQYEPSLAEFRKALELDPDYYPALNGVGVCLLNKYLVSDRTDEEARREGVRLLKRSLQIRPDQQKVLELVSRYG